MIVGKRRGRGRMWIFSQHQQLLHHTTVHYTHCGGAPGLILFVVCINSGGRVFKVS